MEGPRQPPLEEQRKELARKTEIAENQAADAKKLLEHPLVGGALDHYIGEIHKAWENSAPGAKVEREDAYHHLQAAKAIRTYLTETITRGKLARVTAAEVLSAPSRSEGRSSG